MISFSCFCSTAVCIVLTYQFRILSVLPSVLIPVEKGRFNSSKFAKLLFLAMMSTKTLAIENGSKISTLKSLWRRINIQTLSLPQPQPQLQPQSQPHYQVSNTFDINVNSSEIAFDGDIEVSFEYLAATANTLIGIFPSSADTSVTAKLYFYASINLAISPSSHQSLSRNFWCSCSLVVIGKLKRHRRGIWCFVLDMVGGTRYLVLLWYTSSNKRKKGLIEMIDWIFFVEEGSEMKDEEDCWFSIIHLPLVLVEEEGQTDGFICLAGKQPQSNTWLWFQIKIYSYCATYCYP